MTHRLYYDDSYISEFDAQTVSCTETDRGFEVVLNRSAFYPGGGGQPCDTGCIGGVRVSEAFVRGGDIVHITDTPVSGNVRCEIDFDIRFRRMQNHTGEHIVSGLLCSTFGADNVGFHMGSSRSNWPEAWRNLYPSRDCSTRGIYFDQRYHLYPERGWNR